AGIDGHVGLRQLGSQFVLYLLFAVRAIQMLEVASGVIAGTVVELQVLPIELHFQMPEPAILQRVCAGESENVVGGAVLLHLRKDAAEIIGVEEGLAAGVRSQRG